MTNYINVIVTGPVIQGFFEKSLVELNKKVNAKIEEGYKPIGGVNIHKFVIKKDDIERSYECERLIQTMVKESK
jgi:hypothetical protein